MGHKSIHKFHSQSQASKFHATVKGQGHTATLQHESVSAAKADLLRQIAGHLLLSEGVVLPSAAAALTTVTAHLTEGIPMGVYPKDTMGHPKHVVTVHHTAEKTGSVEAMAQGHGAHKSVKTIGASKHEFSSLSSANKFHASCTKQGHTATLQHESVSAVTAHLSTLKG